MLVPVCFAVEGAASCQEAPNPEPVRHRTVRETIELEAGLYGYIMCYYKCETAGAGEAALRARAQTTYNGQTMNWSEHRKETNLPSRITKSIVIGRKWNSTNHCRLSDRWAGRWARSPVQPTLLKMRHYDVLSPKKWITAVPRVAHQLRGARVLHSMQCARHMSNISVAAICKRICKLAQKLMLSPSNSHSSLFVYPFAWVGQSQLKATGQSGLVITQAAAVLDLCAGTVSSVDSQSASRQYSMPSLE